MGAFHSSFFDSRIYQNLDEKSETYICVSWAQWFIWMFYILVLIRKISIFKDRDLSKIA